MFRAYEFEFVPTEGMYAVLPYELENFGATQGYDFDEACYMAVDWLKGTIEDLAMRGEEPPKPTYGHTPRHGGTNVIIGVEAGLETVKKMSAAEAAEVLGVSRGRISQLMKACLLYGYRDGRNTWVTVDSVEARLKDREHLRYCRKVERDEKKAAKKAGKSNASHKASVTKSPADKDAALQLAQNG